ncbi:hypothetical protein Bmyc01_54370 [Bacillus mycoides]|nr:hypothetical protein Bmyc01_54370 [Bacillus mycoides]
MDSQNSIGKEHETVEEKVAREKAQFKKDWENARQYQKNKEEVDRINAELEKGKTWEEVKEELYN